MSKRTSKCKPDTTEFFADLEKQIELVLQATSSVRLGANDLSMALDTQIRKAKARLKKELKCP